VPLPAIEITRDMTVNDGTSGMSSDVLAFIEEQSIVMVKEKIRLAAVHLAQDGTSAL
jgi:hypothetical protein